MTIGSHLVLCVRRTKYGTAHTVGVKGYALFRKHNTDLERCESLTEQEARLDYELRGLLKPRISPPAVEPKPLVPKPRWPQTDEEHAVVLNGLKPKQLERLSTWEQEFIRDMRAWFKDGQSSTWKQRRVLLKIAKKLGAKVI